jgi:hypothetical protein
MKSIVFVLIVLACSKQGFAQSPRKCGCKTFRQWSRDASELKEANRRNKKKEYNTYLVECLNNCRAKEESQTN